MAEREQRTDGEHSDEQVMLPPRPLAARKGRGAVSNIQGRYEVNGREGFDDGWSHDEDDDEAAPFKTQVTDEYAKTILSRNSSPDVPFNVSLNPYRGCEHVNSGGPVCDELWHHPGGTRQSIHFQKSRPNISCFCRHERCSHPERHRTGLWRNGRHSLAR